MRSGLEMVLWNHDFAGNAAGGGVEAWEMRALLSVAKSEYRF